MPQHSHRLEEGCLSKNRRIGTADGPRGCFVPGADFRELGSWPRKTRRKTGALSYVRPGVGHA
jgi:hypothetical protein